MYLVLTTTKGFHVVSNAYGNFAAFVRGLVQHVEKDRIEENVIGLAEHPVRRISDVVLAWIAAVIIAGIISTKILG